MKFEKKKTIIFLIAAFIPAWILQAVASYCQLNMGQTGVILFTLILAVSMYTPLVAGLIARFPFKGVGWKPKLKGKVRYWLAAWFGPAVFSLAGALLYFIIFPDRLDLTGAYIMASLGEEGMAQLTAQGLTIPVYIAVSVVSALLYAPWINTFAALGEEVGWRGFLYPQLKERFGRSKGRILGGIIWGAWHWPVMLLAGYEYGLEYPGAPVLGMAAFCLFCIVSGTLLDVLYERTECIWLPSLGHGAINAVASWGILVLHPDYADQVIFGPLPIGIISMIPALVLAVIYLCKEK